MTSGTAAEAELHLALGRDPNTRLFKNAVGEAWQGSVIQIPGQPPRTILLQNPRRVSYGLFKGSGDFIGFTRVLITPDMVGQTIAAFASLECKAGTGRAREDQRRWRDIVNKFGGRAGVAYTPDQARAILAGQVVG